MQRPTLLVTLAASVYALLVGHFWNCFRPCEGACTKTRTSCTKRSEEQEIHPRFGMPTCFAPGCKSGYRNGYSTSRHFFGPPKDPTEFKRWEQALHRKDKKLTAKCKVCDIHFEDDGIVKHYHHVVAGQEILIARGKWELAPGAIPRLFPALPPHISKPKLSGSRRKSAQKCTVSRKRPVPSSSAEEPPEVEQQDERQAIISNAAVTQSCPGLTLTIDKLSTVTLPSKQWIFESFYDEATNKRCGIFYTRRLVNKIKYKI